MKVSIDLTDFMNLLKAAELGISAGQDFKPDHTIRAWKESFAKLNAIPLDDGSTEEERNEAFLNTIHDECARYGCD